MGFARLHIGRREPIFTTICYYWIYYLLSTLKFSPRNPIRVNNILLSQMWKFKLKKKKKDYVICSRTHSWQEFWRVRSQGYRFWFKICFLPLAESLLLTLVWYSQGILYIGNLWTLSPAVCPLWESSGENISVLEYSVLLLKPREGICTTLQYSCLENPMDRGAW